MVVFVIMEVIVAVKMEMLDSRGDMVVIVRDVIILEMIAVVEVIEG